ncbi:putative oxidoreductase [Hyaloraphidium curvatum]|nr:putative oxidoreductase [Hyaloraphidium curvatum]
MVKGRKFILKARPEGPLDPARDFELVEEELPALGDGELLVKSTTFSVDPTQRIWISGDGYMPAVPVGDVVRAVHIVEVVDSKSSKYQRGDRIQALFGWADQFVIKDDDWRLFAKVDGPVTDAVMLTLSGTGLTAAKGVFDQGAGKFEPGTTVLVSGAAGATGSVAGQLYKSLGCRVVGTAGGPAKCKLVKEKFGFDECVDYKDPDFEAKLKAACPNGIQEYFENVGGKTLEIALDLMNLHGRILYCGNISSYESGDPGRLAGPPNFSLILMKRIRFQGFLVLDNPENNEKHIGTLTKMVADGKLVLEIDQSRKGFENLPAALQDLFAGKNVGKMVVAM